MTPRPQIEQTNDADAGFMLVFAVLMVALVLIGLAVAAPVVAKDLRRDKEIETEHRANEYVRAIRLYYRKFKTYPPSIAALENTNNVRFLRKQYIDPLTGKSDWRIIHVGENKTTVKGFFGQPIGGLNATGGLGSASSMQSSGIGTSSTPGTPSTTIGATPGLAAGFSGATIGGSSSTAGSSSASSSDFGSGGVGPIMGVGTSKTGDSILNPNGQTTYETWEFLYDPKIELLYQQSNILGGGSVGSQSASSFGSSAATGQSNSTSGSSGSSGSTTTTSPSSTPSSSPF